MQEFEIVIIGAGPAGCHGARLLAKLGYKVLLVEQHENFYQNNFSSAATPLETLERFALPKDVVASFWNKIEIVTTHIYRSWKSPNDLGGVFDFAKLRQFLAQEVEGYGGQVWLGHRYLKYIQEKRGTRIFLKQRNGEIISILTRVLVDATGFTRAVIYPDKQDRPKFLKGTGIEYLIEVDDKSYLKQANSLVFLIGYKWSPKGYSWIFPMNDNQLKVGSAWLDGKHKIIDKVNPLKDYTKLIIDDYMKLTSYQIIDVHGSILEYSVDLNDIYYRDHIIAIGDAVSTVNFLGGEGIRHGMQGAEIAVKYIQDYLDNKIPDFQGYQKEMKRYFSKKWNASEKISQRVYLEYSDERIEQGVAYLKYLKLEEILDILFNYNFDVFTKGLKRVFLTKINSLLKTIKKVIFSAN